MKRRTMKGVTLSALLALCLVWLGCGSSSTGPEDGDNIYSAVKDFYHRFDVTGQTGLRVEAISGTVTVKGVAGSDSVVIKGVMRVRAPSQEDADARLAGLDVIAKSVQEEISAETSQPDETEGRSYEVDYEISIPPDMTVLVSSVNGTVTIQDVASELTVSSVNGGVVLDDFEGDASISVVNGTVVGDAVLPQNGQITLAIVNGGIGLEIPRETSADFSARVVNGSINTIDLTFTSVETTPTSITGILGDGEGTVDIIVTNGTILVTGT
ncbi:hypothetical protein ACFL2Z_00805 [Candidatus Eisenbacteria bacterium]|uniref:Adhesin domain-containing protein n=1 Tax=Eiseniibacteriota bacterium TaxID=2212470 RepID=A0ABV6YMZ3_UNCEI